MLDFDFKEVQQKYKQTKELTIHWVTELKDLGEFSEDALLTNLLFANNVYACIENFSWKNIFISLKNILRDYKTPKDIIGKINYSLLHELIHWGSQRRREKIIHYVGYLLNGKSSAKYISEGWRKVTKAKYKIPIIDLE